MRGARLAASLLLAGGLCAGCAGALQPEGRASLGPAREQVQVHLARMAAAAGPGAVVFADPYLTDGQCTKIDGDSSTDNGMFAPYQNADVFTLTGTDAAAIQRIRASWRAAHFTRPDESIFAVDDAMVLPGAAARDGDYTVGLMRVVGLSPAQDAHQFSVAALSLCLSAGASAEPYRPPPLSQAPAAQGSRVAAAARQVERALEPGGARLVFAPAAGAGTPARGPDALTLEDPDRGDFTVGADGTYPAACPARGHVPAVGAAFRAVVRAPDVPATAGLSDNSVLPVPARFRHLVAAWQAAGPTLWEPPAPGGRAPTAVTRVGGLGVRVTEFDEGPPAVGQSFGAYQIDIAAACP